MSDRQSGHDEELLDLNHCNSISIIIKLYDTNVAYLIQAAGMETVFAGLAWFGGKLEVCYTDNSTTSQSQPSTKTKKGGVMILTSNKSRTPLGLGSAKTHFS